MNRRSILSLSILFVVFQLLQVSCDIQKSLKQDDKPLNVIVIMADDLGYETIGAYGGTSYQTPEIDRLAANGMRFEHCYAQPLCTPSRVKIMTGIYNVRNYIRFGILDTGQTTFGHLFQKADYETCIIGKWQLGKNADSPKQAGFDYSCLWQVTLPREDINVQGRDTRFSNPILEVDGKIKTYTDDDFGPDIVSQYGIDFIEKSHQSGKPFFLYYPMILTHCPFSPAPDTQGWDADRLQSVMTYKGEEKYFGDMVSHTDKIVGRINSKLAELGIQDNTILLFTGDNGTDKPIVSTVKGRIVAGAKGQSTDAGTRVPLIVQWPGVIKPNAVSNDLVDFSDILPTICDVSGIQIPESLDLDGQTFFPQMKGQKGTPRKWIYNWYSRNGSVKSASVFARNQRYKLYDNGEFYDVPQDYDEERPLSYDGLDDDTKVVYDDLKKVLDSYAVRRLEDVPRLKVL